MRNTATTAGFILILALAAACTGREPPDGLDPHNVARASPPAAQLRSAPAGLKSPKPTSTPHTAPAPTAACETTAPSTKSPATTRRERTRIPQATSNICWRTPEVQEQLIEDLRIPSCQLINEDELFRIREFDVDTSEAKPGDFDHMPNFRELQIEELRDFPEPGTFDGLGNLEELNIRIASDGWGEWKGPRPTEFAVAKAPFASLDVPRSLEVNTNRAPIAFESGALDGVDQLEHIRLEGISEISSDDLAGLSRVRHVEISYRA